MRVSIPCRSFRSRTSAAALVSCVLAAASLLSPLGAQDAIWDGGGSGVDWSEDANWQSGSAPTADPARTVRFEGSTNLGTAGAPLDQDIAGPFELATLTTAVGANAFIGGQGLRIYGGIVHESGPSPTIGNALELGADVTFMNRAGGENVVYNGNVDLGANQLRFEVPGGNRGHAVNGVISGSGGVFIGGGGSSMGVRLAAGNTFSGGVRAAPNSRATLFVREDEALGSGTAVFVGRNEFTLDAFDGAITLSNPIRIGADTAGSNGAMRFSRGDFILNGALTLENSGGGQERPIKVGNGRVTINGTIGEGPNARALDLIGDGVVTINGANNTYSGPTRVSGTDATLAVDGDITGSSGVTVSGALRGTGRVPAVNVQNGGVLRPGDAAESLTVEGDLALQSGATLRVAAQGADSGRADMDGQLSNIAGATLDLTGLVDKNTTYTVATFAPSDPAAYGEFANLLLDGRETDLYTVTYKSDRIEVTTGDMTVRAADFGWDPADATQALVDAFHSGARTVIVEDMGSPWIVGEPIFVRTDNLEIVVDAGVELLAKEGAFTGKNDRMINLVEVRDVVIRGADPSARSVLRMRKSDYQGSGYEDSEQRHALYIINSENIRVENLEARASGGDGFYVGRPGNNSRNVVLRNVVADDNHRQGMSVTGVDGLLVEDAVFKNTSGIPPQAGVDLEPGGKGGTLKDVVYRNIEVSNNSGPGFLIFLSRLEGADHEVSIRVENLLVKDNGRHGIEIMRVKDLGGRIVFDGFEIDNPNGNLFEDLHGIVVGDKRPDAARVGFKDGTIVRGGGSGGFFSPGGYPIRLEDGAGGVDFSNVTVFDTRRDDFLTATDNTRDVQGLFRFENPGDASYSLGSNSGDINICLVPVLGSGNADTRPAGTDAPRARLRYGFDGRGDAAANRVADGPPLRLRNEAGVPADRTGPDGSGVSGRTWDRALDNRDATAMGAGGSGGRAVSAEPVDFGGARSLTVSGWFRAEGGAPLGDDAVLFAHGDPGEGVRVRGGADGRLTFSLAGTEGQGEWEARGFCPRGRWVFFACVYQSAGATGSGNGWVRVYSGRAGENPEMFDVREVGRFQADLGPLASLSMPFAIGNAADGGLPFRGRIDNFRLHFSDEDASGALSPAQMEAHIRSTDPVAELENFAGRDRWRFRHFNTLESIGIYADGADFSGNGLPNLLHYALGLDPESAQRPELDPADPGAPGLPLVRLPGKDAAPHFLYWRDTARDDIRYEVEYSTDLQTWETPPPGQLVEREGSFEIWRVPPPAEDGAGFFRLRVGATK